MSFVGLGFLWAGDVVWEEMRRVMVETRGLAFGWALLWLMMMVLAGITFGLTATLATRPTNRPHPAILAAAAVAPFLIVAYFFALYGLGWALPVGSVPTFVVRSETLWVCAVLLGVIGSGLFAPAIALRRESEAADAEAQP